jgi:hypothetical protein
LDFHSTSLAPASERASVDERVSPFSTPPSSPEKPSPRNVPSDKPERFKIPPLRPITEPPHRLMGSDRPPPPTPSAVRDARELGFSRQRPAPEPSRATKPVMVPLSAPDRRPEILPGGPRDTRFSESPSHRPPASDSPDDRPGLPPRFNARPFANSPPTSESRPPEPPRHSLDVGRSNGERVSPSRRVSVIETNFPPPPRRETGSTTATATATASASAGGWSGSENHANGLNGLDQANQSSRPRRQSPQPPPVSRETKYTSSTPVEQNRNPRVDEPERVVEEAPIPRTDYPDSSQV